ITTEMVNNLLISREGKGNKKSVLQIVADYFQLRPEDITGKSRNKTTVLARQVTSYVMRQEEDLSFAEIGRILGNRNHATIIHHYNQIVYGLRTSPALQYKLLDIKRQLDLSRG
ncbi:MAG: helix-turn-helix domain-containing protein, partial [Chloroflexota bacterium]|nr:helix-turn-helix domain-containing protein [Chloroflexota bacterium]